MQSEPTNGRRATALAMLRCFTSLQRADYVLPVLTVSGHTLHIALIFIYTYTVKSLKPLRLRWYGQIEGMQTNQVQ